MTINRLDPTNALERRRSRYGQSTVEYALIVAAVAAALAAMSTYVRRAVQANFKQLEEAVNGSVKEP